MTQEMTPGEEDWRPLVRFGYAPGDYFCRCLTCDMSFVGEKRAHCCRECAERLLASAGAPKAPIADYAVYLDMDGVLADFDEGIRRLGFEPDPEFNRSGHAMDDEAKLWKAGLYDVLKGTDFYFQVPILAGAFDLYRAVAAARPIILTAAPKFGASEDDYYLNPHWLGGAYHKRRWLEEHFLPRLRNQDDPPRAAAMTRVGVPDECFICTTSARKFEFIGRKHSDHQILIDDRVANCEAWENAGGIAILHTGIAETLAALDAIVAGARR